MAHTRDQYRQQLKALLPPGKALPREPGTTLDALLDAMAAELVRIDDRADDLIDEAIPSTTSELLADWERVAGLPDPCVADQVQNRAQRRAALVSKLASRGGQSAAYFIAVAAALGFEVTITEFRPFRAGMSYAGDALTNGDWVFTWRVNAPTVTISEFKAGQNTVGDPLRSWGNDLLECRLGHNKPAHTILQFAYRQTFVATQFAVADGTTQDLQLNDGNGHDVTQNVTVTAMHRTDWQGRQLLYPVPRTNQDANSNDGAAWIAGTHYSTAASEKTFAGRIPYTEIIRQVLTSSSPVYRMIYDTAAAVRVTWSLAVRAGTSNKIDIGLYQAAANPTSGGGDPAASQSRIISGPGTINQVNPEQLRDLSPDEDTVIEIWRDYVAGDRISPIIYIGSRDATAVIGSSNLVTRSMITFGQTEQGALIETDGAPRTVTDYTYNSAGKIHLGELPAEGAVFDWDGTTKPAS